MKGVRVGMMALLLSIAGYCGAVRAEQEQVPEPDQERALVKPGASKSGDKTRSMTGADVMFRLAGRWKINEAYAEGGEGKGTASYKKALDNTHLIGDYKSRCKELGFDVQGHAVFTYDPDAEAYHYWWFDNYGASSEFQGEYNSSKNALVFTRQLQDDDGESVEHVHTFRFVSENEIKLTMQISGEDKRPETVLTSTFIKRGSKSEEDEEDAEKPKPKHKVSRGIR